MSSSRSQQVQSHPRGFTLLEVMIAVAILAVSLTSLLTSQMNAIRATRYAQSVSVAAFLAEYQIIEIEWIIKQENKGWGDSDREFSGDFGDQGWPEMRYECLVDKVELPEHNALVAAANAGDTDDQGSATPSGGMQTAGQSAFGALGMVWPMIKGAIEQAIRKVHCTVFWEEGKITHDFKVETYWTDPAKLNQLPQAGGEVGRDDDVNEEAQGGQGAPPSGGANPAAAPGATPSMGGF